MHNRLLSNALRRSARISEIQVRNENLYFTIPLTHRVWSYNTQSGEVSSFELEHSSMDISRYADMDNSTVPEILPKLEFESDPFLFEDHLSLLTYYDRTWYLGLYSYEGSLIAKDTVADYIRFVENGQYFGLVETDSELVIYEFRPVMPPGSL